jgi:hypothetical protein
VSYASTGLGGCAPCLALLAFGSAEARGLGKPWTDERRGPGIRDVSAAGAIATLAVGIFVATLLSAGRGKTARG